MSRNVSTLGFAKGNLRNIELFPFRSCGVSGWPKTLCFSKIDSYKHSKSCTCML